MVAFFSALHWYEIAAYLFVALLYIIFFAWAKREYRRLNEDKKKP